MVTRTEWKVRLQHSPASIESDDDIFVNRKYGERLVNQQKMALTSALPISTKKKAKTVSIVSNAPTVHSM